MEDLPDLIESSSIKNVSANLLDRSTDAACNYNAWPNSNGYADEDSDDAMEEDKDCLSNAYESDENDTRDEFCGVQKTECLVCETILENPEKIIQHMIEKHNFDLVKICIHFKFDQILFIKFINYIRRNKIVMEDLNSNSFSIDRLNDAHMEPYKVDDAMLNFDIESYLEELQESGKLSSTELEPLQSAAKIYALQSENEYLKHIVEKQQQLLKDMGQSMLNQTSAKEEVVGERTLEDDAGYIESYSSYEIHDEMLNDRVRTEAYRDAICHNQSVFLGARVLDLGCGTGILSGFCAESGAMTVDAVDMATIAYDAMEIISKKKLDHIVHVTKGRLEDQSYPYKFDVIVSEWMGYFLLFEGMLDSVIYARDRFLKSGGTMMPNRCTMHLCALDDFELHKRVRGFWNDVYGFDMSSIGRKYTRLAKTTDVKPETIATDAAQIAEFDINKCSTSDTQFTSAFSLSVKRNTNITAFAGYFDTFFDLPKPVTFSTGPAARTTHWKQTVFVLPQPLPAQESTPLEGEIIVRRHCHDVRALEVTLTVADQTYYYTVE